MLPPKKFWNNKNVNLDFKKYKKIDILINKFNINMNRVFVLLIDVLISPSCDG